MKENGTSQAGEPAAALLSSPTPPPQRILVVEDDDDIRLLNTDELSCAGYDVDAAGDGAAAWEALQHIRYDLLITDNNMPNVSGIELLKKLRSACMDLPVIMASGAAPDEEFTRHPWLQPDATLTKPYTLAELLKTVKTLLQANHPARDWTAPPTNCQLQTSPIGSPWWK